MGIVEAVLERYPLEQIAEGDTFVGNDAYTGGGTHLPDIVLATPVFHDGMLVGWATNTGAPCRFCRSRPRPHLPGGAAHPAGRLYRRGNCRRICSN